MIDYLVDDRKYILSYRELREWYETFCQLKDEDFLKRLPEILHTACIICWLKEIPTQYCLGDRGIIHELAHLMHIPDETTVELRRIRILFEEQCKLV